MVVVVAESRERERAALSDDVCCVVVLWVCMLMVGLIFVVFIKRAPLHLLAKLRVM
jgi:hypothetical protein